MTSIHGEKDVINETLLTESKGKALILDILKRLDGGERGAPAEAWRGLRSYCGATPSTRAALRLLRRFYDRTALFILKDEKEWLSAKNESIRNDLIKVLRAHRLRGHNAGAEGTSTNHRRTRSMQSDVNEVKHQKTGRTGSYTCTVLDPSWEREASDRSQALAAMATDAWGHPVLQALLDKKVLQPDADEICKWLWIERWDTFVARLHKLCSLKRDSLALRLTAAAADRLPKIDTDTTPAVTGDVWSEITNSDSSIDSHTDDFHNKSGFHRQSHVFIHDLRLVLLHRLNELQKCVQLLKEVPLDTALSLVERLSSRGLCSTGPEKKLWKHSKAVALLAAQVSMARCMSLKEETSLELAGELCIRLAHLYNNTSKLKEELKQLLGPASTTRHIHTCCRALYRYYSTLTEPSNEESQLRRLLLCDMYTRALNWVLSDLVKMRADNGPDADESKALAETTAQWLVQFSEILRASSLRRECMLTAFSLHPTVESFELIAKEAEMISERSSESTPLRDAPSTKTDNLADFSAKCSLDERKTDGAKVDFSSWASDSKPGKCTGFVITSRKEEMSGDKLEVDVLADEILDSKLLGLSADQQADLTTLLGNPRNKALHWSLGWPALRKRCLEHMESSGRAPITKLQYLDLDYAKYEDLADSDDEEERKDIFYGYQKGYEHHIQWDDENAQVDQDPVVQSTLSEKGSRRRIKPHKIKTDSDSDYVIEPRQRKLILENSKKLSRNLFRNTTDSQWQRQVSQVQITQLENPECYFDRNEAKVTQIPSLYRKEMELYEKYHKTAVLGIVDTTIAKTAIDFESEIFGHELEYDKYHTTAEMSINDTAIAKTDIDFENEIFGHELNQINLRNEVGSRLTSDDLLVPAANEEVTLMTDDNLALETSANEDLLPQESSELCSILEQSHIEDNSQEGIEQYTKHTPAPIRKPLDLDFLMKLQDNSNSRKDLRTTTDVEPFQYTNMCTTTEPSASCSDSNVSKCHLKNPSYKVSKLKILRINIPKVEKPRDPNAPQRVRKPRDPNAPPRIQKPKEKVEKPRDPNAPQRLRKPREPNAPPIIRTPKDPNAPPRVQKTKDPNAPPRVKKIKDTNAPPRVRKPRDPNAPPRVRKPRDPNAPPRVRKPKDPNAPPRVRKPRNLNAPPSVQKPKDSNAPPKVPKSRDPNAPTVIRKPVDPNKTLKDPNAPPQIRKPEDPNTPYKLKKCRNSNAPQRVFKPKDTNATLDDSVERDRLTSLQNDVIADIFNSVDTNAHVTEENLPDFLQQLLNNALKQNSVQSTSSNNTETHKSIANETACLSSLMPRADSMLQNEFISNMTLDQPYKISSKDLRTLLGSESGNSNSSSKSQTSLINSTCSYSKPISPHVATFNKNRTNVISPSACSHPIEQRIPATSTVSNVRTTTVNRVILTVPNSKVFTNALDSLTMKSTPITKHQTKQKNPEDCGNDKDKTFTAQEIIRTNTPIPAITTAVNVSQNPIIQMNKPDFSELKISHTEIKRSHPVEQQRSCFVPISNILQTVNSNTIEPLRMPSTGRHTGLPATVINRPQSQKVYSDSKTTQDELLSLLNQSPDSTEFDYLSLMDLFSYNPNAENNATSKATPMTHHSQTSRTNKISGGSNIVSQQRDTSCVQQHSVASDTPYDKPVSNVRSTIYQLKKTYPSKKALVSLNESKPDSKITVSPMSYTMLSQFNDNTSTDSINVSQVQNTKLNNANTMYNSTIHAQASTATNTSESTNIVPQKYEASFVKQHSVTSNTPCNAPVSSVGSTIHSHVYAKKALVSKNDCDHNLKRTISQMNHYISSENNVTNTDSINAPQINNVNHILSDNDTSQTRDASFLKQNSMTSNTCSKKPISNMGSTILPPNIYAKKTTVSKNDCDNNLKRTISQMNYTISRNPNTDSINAPQIQNTTVLQISNATATIRNAHASRTNNVLRGSVSQKRDESFDKHSVLSNVHYNKAISNKRSNIYPYNTSLVNKAPMSKMESDNNLKSKDSQINHTITKQNLIIDLLKHNNQQMTADRIIFQNQKIPDMQLLGQTLISRIQTKSKPMTKPHVSVKIDKAAKSYPFYNELRKKNEANSIKIPTTSFEHLIQPINAGTARIIQLGKSVLSKEESKVPNNTIPIQARISNLTKIHNSQTITAKHLKHEDGHIDVKPATQHKHKVLDSNQAQKTICRVVLDSPSEKTILIKSEPLSSSLDNKCNPHVTSVIKNNLNWKIKNKIRDIEEALHESKICSPQISPQHSANILGNLIFPTVSNSSKSTLNSHINNRIKETYDVPIAGEILVDSYPQYDNINTRLTTKKFNMMSEQHSNPANETVHVAQKEEKNVSYSVLKNSRVSNVTSPKIGNHSKTGMISNSNLDVLNQSSKGHTGSYLNMLNQQCSQFESPVEANNIPKSSPVDLNKQYIHMISTLSQSSVDANRVFFQNSQSNQGRPMLEINPLTAYNKPISANVNAFNSPNVDLGERNMGNNNERLSVITRYPNLHQTMEHPLKTESPACNDIPKVEIEQSKGNLTNEPVEQRCLQSANRTLKIKSASSEISGSSILLPKAPVKEKLKVVLGTEKPNVKLQIAKHITQRSKSQQSEPEISNSNLTLDSVSKPTNTLNPETSKKVQATKKPQAINIPPHIPGVNLDKLLLNTNVTIKYLKQGSQGVKGIHFKNNSKKTNKRIIQNKPVPSLNNKVLKFDIPTTNLNKVSNSGPINRQIVRLLKGNSPKNVSNSIIGDATKSFIGNDDLDELLDEDLIKEIGELSSDDDVSNLSVTKIHNITSTNHSSDCNQSMKHLLPGNINNDEPNMNESKSEEKVSSDSSSSILVNCQNQLSRELTPISQTKIPSLTSSNNNFTDIMDDAESAIKPDIIKKKKLIGISKNVSIAKSDLELQHNEVNYRKSAHIDVCENVLDTGPVSPKKKIKLDVENKHSEALCNQNLTNAKRQSNTLKSNDRKLTKLSFNDVFNNLKADSSFLNNFITEIKTEPLCHKSLFLSDVSAINDTNKNDDTQYVDVNVDKLISDVDAGLINAKKQNKQTKENKTQQNRTKQTEENKFKYTNEIIPVTFKTDDREKDYKPSESSQGNFIPVTILTNDRMDAVFKYNLLESSQNASIPVTSQSDNASYVIIKNNSSESRNDSILGTFQTNDPIDVINKDNLLESHQCSKFESKTVHESNDNISQTHIKSHSEKLNMDIMSPKPDLTSNLSSTREDENKVYEKSNDMKNRRMERIMQKLEEIRKEDRKPQLPIVTLNWKMTKSCRDKHIKKILNEKIKRENNRKCLPVIALPWKTYSNEVKLEEPIKTNPIIVSDIILETDSINETNTSKNISKLAEKFSAVTKFVTMKKCRNFTPKISGISIAVNNSEPYKDVLPRVNCVTNVVQSAGIVTAESVTSIDTDMKVETVSSSDKPQSDMKITKLAKTFASVNKFVSMKKFNKKTYILPVKSTDINPTSVLDNTSSKRIEDITLYKSNPDVLSNVIDVIDLSSDNESDDDIQFVSTTYLYDPTEDPLNISIEKGSYDIKPCHVEIEKVDLHKVQSKINDKIRRKIELFAHTKQRQIKVILKRLSTTDIISYSPIAQDVNARKRISIKKDFSENDNKSCDALISISSDSISIQSDNDIDSQNIFKHDNLLLDSTKTTSYTKFNKKSDKIEKGEVQSNSFPMSATKAVSLIIDITPENHFLDNSDCNIKSSQNNYEIKPDNEIKMEMAEVDYQDPKQNNNSSIFLKGDTSNVHINKDVSGNNVKGNKHRNWACSEETVSSLHSEETVNAISNVATLIDNSSARKVFCSKEISNTSAFHTVSGDNGTHNTDRMETNIESNEIENTKCEKGSIEGNIDLKDDKTRTFGCDKEINTGMNNILKNDKIRSIDYGKNIKEFTAMDTQLKVYERNVKGIDKIDTKFKKYDSSPIRGTSKDPKFLEVPLNTTEILSINSVVNVYSDEKLDSTTEREIDYNKTKKDDYFKGVLCNNASEINFDNSEGRNLNCDSDDVSTTTTNTNFEDNSTRKSNDIMEILNTPNIDTNFNNHGMGLFYHGKNSVKATVDLTTLKDSVATEVSSNKALVNTSMSGIHFESNMTKTINSGKEIVKVAVNNNFLKYINYYKVPVEIAINLNISEDNNRVEDICNSENTNTVTIENNFNTIRNTDCLKDNYANKIDCDDGVSNDGSDITIENNAIRNVDTVNEINTAIIKTDLTSNVNRISIVNEYNIQNNIVKHIGNNEIKIDVNNALNVKASSSIDFETNELKKNGCDKYSVTIDRSETNLENNELKFCCNKELHILEARSINYDGGTVCNKVIETTDMGDNNIPDVKTDTCSVVDQANVVLRPQQHNTSNVENIIVNQIRSKIDLQQSDAKKNNTLGKQTEHECPATHKVEQLRSPHIYTDFKYAPIMFDSKEATSLTNLNYSEFNLVKNESSCFVDLKNENSKPNDICSITNSETPLTLTDNLYIPSGAKNENPCETTRNSVATFPKDLTSSIDYPKEVTDSPYHMYSIQSLEHLTLHAINNYLYGYTNQFIADENDTNIGPSVILSRSDSIASQSDCEYNHSILGEVKPGDEFFFGDEEVTVFGIYTSKSSSCSSIVTDSHQGFNRSVDRISIIESEVAGMRSLNSNLDLDNLEKTQSFGKNLILPGDTVDITKYKAKRKSTELVAGDNSNTKRMRAMVDSSIGHSSEDQFHDSENYQSCKSPVNVEDENCDRRSGSYESIISKKNERSSGIYSPIFSENIHDTSTNTESDDDIMEISEGFREGSGSDHTTIEVKPPESAAHLPDCNFSQPLENLENDFNSENILFNKKIDLINETKNILKNYTFRNTNNNIVFSHHVENALKDISVKKFNSMSCNKKWLSQKDRQNDEKNFLTRHVPGMNGVDFFNPPRHTYTVKVVQVGQPPVSVPSQNSIQLNCQITESQTSPLPVEDQHQPVTAYVDLTPNSSEELLSTHDVDPENESKDEGHDQVHKITKKEQSSNNIEESNDNVHIVENTQIQSNEINLTYGTDISEDINRELHKEPSIRDGNSKFIQIVSTSLPQNFIHKTDDGSHNSHQHGFEDTASVQFVTPSAAANNNASNKAQTLVNLLTQKIPKHTVAEPQSITVNTYSKCNPVASYSIQHALAQILSPQINQSGNTDSPQSIVGSPQLLHIVQGKPSIATNHSLNSQIVGDSSQQSAIVNTTNQTQVLHILQGKNTHGCPTSGQSQNQPTIGGLSFVEAGSQAANQVLQILNASNQAKANATAQLLKRVNLLTSITNAQGANEQKMVQFVCKSADGKTIQLNSQHPRGMVLRLQPIETPTPVQHTQKSNDEQNITIKNETMPTPVEPAEQTPPLEIKSRSVYEENYAKFIQGSSRAPSPEKSTSLPKFNQAFGKSAFQDENSLGKDIEDENLGSPTPLSVQQESNNILENNVTMSSIGQLSSPPLLIRKSPQTSISHQTLIQQLKQSMAPMNIQTMHGGVIYTRQIPLNIGGGQTINLITVPSTEMLDETVKPPQQQEGKQECVTEQPVIRIIPQDTHQTHQIDTGTEDGVQQQHFGESNSQNLSQTQPVVTQMRIKLPMLSKGPQMAPGTRVMRPVLQIQRNVIPGAIPSVYQQFVLTAAPPVAQQTTRLQQPVRQNFQRPPTPTPTETNMSTSTLEQLREFDMVLEQVKERSTVQPGTPVNPTAILTGLTQDQITTNVIETSSVSNAVPNASREVLYSIGNNQTLNVTYVNQKLLTTSPVIATTYRSTSSPAASTTPQTSPQIHLSQSIPNSPVANQVKSTPPTPKMSSKTLKKTSKPSNISTSNSSKAAPVATKTAIQKPLEDEQTTQRILYILAEYKEQVENSPDKDKPAPRRRSNPPTNPSTSSKRKKSSGSKKGTSGQSHRDTSPVGGVDDPSRTMGSEDSSCGYSQGECSELGAQSIENQSPQDSPQKAVRKLVFHSQETDQPVMQSSNPSQRNVIIADGQAIAMTRQTAGKGATAVLMPANYLLPVSMVKSGHQITIVTNQGPKLLTVPQGEAGTTNTLFLQRLINPTGLKPIMRPGQVRHVRLPASNLQTFNLTQSMSTSQHDTINWLNSTAGLSHHKTDEAPDSVISESSDAPSLKGDNDNASTGGESIRINDNAEFTDEQMLPTSIGQSTPDEGIFSNATDSPAMTPRSSDSQVQVSRSPSSSTTVNLIQVQTTDGTQQKLFQVQNSAALSSLIQLTGKNCTTQALQQLSLQNIVSQDVDAPRNVMFVRKQTQFEGQFGLESDKIQTVIESGQSMKLLPGLVTRCAPGAIITMHRAPQPAMDDLSGQPEKTLNKDIADGNTPWRFISTTGETVNIVSSGGPTETLVEGANQVTTSYSSFTDSPSNNELRNPAMKEYSPEPTTQQLFDKMFVSCDSKKSFVDDSETSRAYSADDKTHQIAVEEPKQTSASLHQSQTTGFTVHHHTSGPPASVTHGQLAGAKLSQHAHTLRHKYALIEHELRLQKSLSEECEDLGVDSPSASELFPEAELLFAPTSPAASQSLPALAENHHHSQDSPQSSALSLTTATQSHLSAVGEIRHEDFVRSHPNTTFSTHPTLEVPGYASSVPIQLSSKMPNQHSELERLISSINSEDDNSQPSKVALNRFEQILGGESDDASSAPPCNVAQVIRRADKNGSGTYDPACGSILKSIIERDNNCSSPEPHAELFWDSNSNSNQSDRRHVVFSSEECCKSPIGHSYDETVSTDSSMESSQPVRLSSVIKSSNLIDNTPILRNALARAVDNSSPESEMDSMVHIRSFGMRRTRVPSVSPRSLSDELNAGTEIETSSPEDKNTLKSGLLLHHRLESDSSMPDSPLTPQIKEDESSSGPGRRASLRGIVKRGCHCCNGSPAPQRPKKPRFRFDSSSGRSRKSPDGNKRSRSPSSVVSS